MFTKTRALFSAMRPTVKSLVYVRWVSTFAGGMAGIFIQVFLYERFGSIEFNIWATLWYFTGIMLGFCVLGYLAVLLRLNIKSGFILGFIVMGASVFSLLYISGIASAYVAMALMGLGQGIFSLAVNTYELSETVDHERDFYSSALNAGNQVLSLAGPAAATLLIWVSASLLHFGAFSILFAVTPLVYLLGFLGLSGIGDYRPKPITAADIRHFFVDPKNQAAQLYTMGTGFGQTLSSVAPVLAVLLVLGSALNVGIYNTVFALFTAFCVLLLAQYRTPANRLKIFGLSTIGLIVVTIGFGYAFTLAALIIYTIVEGFLTPVINVSAHVIELASMEIGRKESDFYATMLLRDFFLWVWRCVGGLIFLAVIGYEQTQQESLSIGLYILAASLAITYAGAHILLKKR